jgi:hypothetical protein
MENADTWMVHIAPVEGRCDVLPDQRQYEIRLEGSRRPERVTVDGADAASWTYDPETLTTTIPIPMRDKRQPVTMTAVATGGISVLGESHNRQVIVADVRRLLGDRCPSEAGDVDAVLGLDAHVSGRADAIARLGGPFVRIIEFTTPEESSQQLGRVIVGAPVRADAPYDLDATFTLFREGRSERRTIRVEGITESHILDVPFTFDGQVRTAQWQAEVKITWQGETLTYTHQSQHLFPTIYAWRTIVYDREKQPITLEQVMDETGNVNSELDWKTCVQTLTGLRNVNQHHAVLFFREHRQALQADEPLAAYVVTTIVSPDEREVVVRFRSVGTTTFYLNGQQIDDMPAEKEPEGLSPFFHGLRKTAVMHLHVGENTLVVDTRSSPGETYWFFGGALVTPDGDLMTDLVFE